MTTTKVGYSLELNLRAIALKSALFVRKLTDSSNRQQVSRGMDIPKLCPVCAVDQAEEMFVDCTVPPLLESEQLLTQGEIFEDEILAGTERTNNPAE